VTADKIDEEETWFPQRRIGIEEETPQGENLL
jgi:hypothetical protein